ncbi:MAG: aminoglycoside 6-adenylyltransferase [Bacteroidetes bacterium]|nr:MAG: aminoglycoside 6-adenylyltransferase [Bacteroidota bacterium]
MQMTDSMEIVDDPKNEAANQITYLMLFTDTNRIDLKLKTIDKQKLPNDSLTKILLDKDALFPGDLKSSDEDYWVKKPTQKQFSECCNEFWWVSTYVMKGVLRQEEMYAKDMLEKPVRDMFLLMLSWQVGIKNNFSINLGSSNKFLKKHIDNDLWKRILITYPNAELSNIYDSLMEMTDLFHSAAIEIAEELDYIYNLQEAQQTKEYLLQRGKEFNNLL